MCIQGEAIADLVYSSGNSHLTAVISYQVPQFAAIPPSLFYVSKSFVIETVIRTVRAILDTVILFFEGILDSLKYETREL